METNEASRFKIRELSKHVFVIALNRNSGNGVICV